MNILININFSPFMTVFYKGMKLKKMGALMSDFKTILAIERVTLILYPTPTFQGCHYF